MNTYNIFNIWYTATHYVNLSLPSRKILLPEERKSGLQMQISGKVPAQHTQGSGFKI